MVIFQRFMPVDMYQSSNPSLVFSYFFFTEKKMDGEMIIIYIKFISFYRRLLNIDLWWLVPEIVRATYKS